MIPTPAQQRLIARLPAGVVARAHPDGVIISEDWSQYFATRGVQGAPRRQFTQGALELVDARPGQPGVTVTRPVASARRPTATAATSRPAATAPRSTVAASARRRSLERLDLAVLKDETRTLHRELARRAR